MATSIRCFEQDTDPDSVNVSWLQRWRERYEIKSLKLHGESADCKEFNGWLEENRETALFCRADGAKTFVSLNETNPKGRKSEKSRVSLLIGCGADDAKFPLYAIGGAANPRWPRPAEQNRRAERYFSSRKGWMTTDIFITFLRDLESRCAKSKKKKLLLKDNCSSHKGLENTYDGNETWMKILYFPKRTTNKLKPCDQGVIHSLEAHYRAKLLRLLIRIFSEPFL